MGRGKSNKIGSSSTLNSSTSNINEPTNNQYKNSIRIGRMENFGNASVMEETVKYGREGVSMPRKDAKRIDQIKGDLGALSEAFVRRGLTEAERKERETLQNELRKYRDKYKINVSKYLPGGR